MALAPKDLQRIKDAFNTWAAHHPDPDKVSFSIGSSALSPREAAAAIDAETPAGKGLIRMVEIAVEDDPSNLEFIISSMTKAPKP